jgi:hypothetical protein
MKWMVWSLLALGLFVLVLLARRARFYIVRQLIDYHVGRICSTLGFGTSWLFWIFLRLMVMFDREKDALVLVRRARVGVRCDPNFPIDLHRGMLHGLQENLAQSGVPSETIQQITETLVHEVVRRDEKRILFWVEREQSFAVIARIWQLGERSREGQDNHPSLG